MSLSRRQPRESLFRVDISDKDIYEAMRDVPGYLDVTPGDLKLIYAHAYRHAFERIACSVRAADIMTRNVFSVRRDTPLKVVAVIMAENEISGVPVVDDGRRVIGVISEKDFCLHMGDHRAKSVMDIVADCVRNRGCLAMTIRDQRAGEIMSTPAITVSEDATLLDITTALTSHGINRVPVVGPGGALAGIVSRADVVRASFPTAR